jgi:hypothetical protein
LKQRWAGVGAILGGVIFAAAGAVMAAGNLGWLGGSPEANDLFVYLGVGLALVVGGFAATHGADISSRGQLGRIVSVAAIAASVILLGSRLLEFAILGTLAIFVTLLGFTRLVQRDKLLPTPDVVLLSVAMVASITWNTETPSAALLIVVGLAASWISYHALVANRWGKRARLIR